MSILESKSTILDGMALCDGTPFLPCDSTSSYAFFERNGHRCCVIYETAFGGYLQFLPAWQLPQGSRNKRAWHRFAFESDNDLLLDINIDFRDGEIRYIDNDVELDDIESIRSTIERDINLLTILYDDFKSFVHSQMLGKID